MTIRWKSKDVRTANTNHSSIRANYIQVKRPQLRIQRAFLDTFRCIKCIVLPCCLGLYPMLLLGCIIHISLFLYVSLTDYLNIVEYCSYSTVGRIVILPTMQSAPGVGKSCLRMSKQRHAYARRDPFGSTCTTRKGGGTPLRTPVPPI